MMIFKMHRRKNPEIIQNFTPYQSETVYLGRSINTLPGVAKYESIRVFPVLITVNILYTAFLDIIRNFSAITLSLHHYADHAGI
jgi:hypothetical protein